MVPIPYIEAGRIYHIYLYYKLVVINLTLLYLDRETT